jgi:hypothetical protein
VVVVVVVSLAVALVLVSDYGGVSLGGLVMIRCNLLVVLTASEADVSCIRRFERMQNVEMGARVKQQASVRLAALSSSWMLKWESARE